MYTHDEVKTATLNYFDGDELATSVWIDKYALRDEQDNLLEKTPADMHRRMAREIARIEKEKFSEPLTEDEIFSYFEGFRRIVPQGSIMYGLGNKYKYVSLGNCYTLETPYDSISGILYVEQQLANLSKRRSGIGIDLSKLRPIGTPTTNSSKTSSGITTFMEWYSFAIRSIAQAGRRAAGILTISIHHPEVLNFIHYKKNLIKATGANVSVRLTDEFLQAAQNNEEYEQRWPVDSKNPTISKKVNAKEIWDEIIKSAHNSGEPGLLMWGNINRETPSEYYNDYLASSVNPCAEQILAELDSCRLLLLNLYSYVNNPFKDTAKFDYDLFYNDVQIAQRIMDDIVDLELECIDRIITKINNDPEPDYIKVNELLLWNKVREKAKNGRRTGTGITALGDCLAALNIGFGTEKSIEDVDKIYKTLKFAAYRSSIDIAKQLGSFTGYSSEAEKKCPFIQRFADETLELSSHTISGADLLADMEQYGRRNVTCLTTSPAGSVSLLTQTTSGIEPVFQLEYTRRKKISDTNSNITPDFIDKNGDKWQNYKVVHPKIKEWMKVTGETDITKSPWITADKINWQNRVKMQAVAQRHICSSISSTINVPNSATEEDIAKIYEEAWKSGVKGITVYRDKCRDGVLINDKTDEIKRKNLEKTERPRELKCDVHHVLVNKVDYFVLVGLWQDGTPYEMFAGKNGCIGPKVERGRIIRKKKDFYKFISEDEEYELAPITGVMSDIEETISRLTSGLLRSGADMNFIVTQLEKIGNGKTDAIHNFGKCLSRCLKRYIKDNTPYDEEKCPECGGQLVRKGGCPSCENCSYSKCV